MCLSLSLLSYGQDADLFNPVDEYGNNWFQTTTNKATYFNFLVSEAKRVKNGTSVSFRNDVFVVNIKIDVDHTDNNSNETYTSLVAFKNGTSNGNTFSTSHNDSTTTRYPYVINYFVGSNMTNANCTINQNVPAGDWGEILIDNIYSEELTSAEIDASRDAWLPEDYNFDCVLESVTMSGY